jgi:hypothetical protein
MAYRENPPAATSFSNLRRKGAGNVKDAYNNFIIEYRFLKRRYFALLLQVIA